MDYLTKDEAEERFRFAPERALFCPDCLTELREITLEDGSIEIYCPNEMCLNEEREVKDGDTI